MTCRLRAEPHAEDALPAEVRALIEGIANELRERGAALVPGSVDIQIDENGSIACSYEATYPLPLVSFVHRVEVS